MPTSVSYSLTGLTAPAAISITKKLVGSASPGMVFLMSEFLVTVSLSVGTVMRSTLFVVAYSYRCATGGIPLFMCGPVM